MSKRTVVSLAALVGLALVGLWAVLSVLPPAVRGTDTPPGEFSAARAFAHVQQIGKTQHVAGSAANDSVRDYLVTTLRGMGLDPQIQDTVGVAREDETVAAARVRNVVTRIPGQSSSGRVFLVAHYDSVQNGPGANDDGAGVSSILETLRALKQGLPLKNDIVVVFTDAEEACLCGAHAFVDQHELARDGGVVLNVEARGSSGPAIMFETSSGNADVVGVYGKHVPDPVGTSFAVEVYRILPNDTDFSPFRDSKKFGGLNTAYIDGQAAYHKAQDTPDRMDQRSLQHHGNNLLALTQSFGNGDLAAVTQPGNADATYFPALGVLVTYPGMLVWPLAGLALLAVAVLAWRSVRSRQTSYKRIVIATALTLVPILLTTVAAQLFWMLLTWLRPGFGNMIDPWWPVWFRWAVIALVLTILLSWYGVMRSKLDQASVSIGALVWLAIFGVAMAAAVPGGSYLTAVPALAGAIAGLINHFAARIVAAAVAIIILAPTVTLFFPALGLATGAAPALFAILLGLALIPVLDGVPSPALSWATRSAVLLLVVLTGTGLLVNRFDADSPSPSQLMYALDADTGKAVWATTESTPGPYTKQYVSTSDTAAAFPSLHAKWTGPAQATSLPPAQVTRSGKTILIVPQRNVRLIHIKVDGGTIASVGGQSIDSSELLFHAPPAAGLELVLSTDGPVTVRVADGSDGLDNLPGYKPRPPDVTAAGSHSSDLVLVAKTFVLP